MVYDTFRLKYRIVLFLKLYVSVCFFFFAIFEIRASYFCLFVDWNEAIFIYSGENWTILPTLFIFFFPPLFLGFQRFYFCPVFKMFIKNMPCPTIIIRHKNWRFRGIAPPPAQWLQSQHPRARWRNTHSHERSMAFGGALRPHRRPTTSRHGRPTTRTYAIQCSARNRLYF